MCLLTESRPRVCSTSNSVVNRQLDRLFCGNISYTDAQIGRILDELGSQELTSNTFIVLISDHGYLNGEHHGMWAKHCLWLPVANVPLIIAAPHKSAKGKVSRSPVEMIDLYPTLVELAALKPPTQRFEGISLVPAVRSPETQIHQYAFCQHNRAWGRAIFDSRYRFTQYETGDRELHDHKVDSAEFGNPANQSQHAEIANEL